MARLHLPPLQASLTEAGIATEAIILPAGEATKSMARLAQVVKAAEAEPPMARAPTMRTRRCMPR